MLIEEIKPALSSHAVKILNLNNIHTVDEMLKLTIAQITNMYQSGETAAYNIIENILKLNGNPFRPSQYITITLHTDMCNPYTNNIIHEKNSKLLCVTLTDKKFKENITINNEPLIIIGYIDKNNVCIKGNKYKYRRQIQKSVSGEITKIIDADCNESAYFAFKYYHRKEQK